jgi:ABC-type Mn2+/Zn2+ transport system ATPase subunit
MGVASGSSEHQGSNSSSSQWVSGELGAMIRPCRTILIDEGFTACDADHIMNSDFLRIIDRCGKFSTVLIVTHIEALQNGVSNTINMQKKVRMCV